MNWFKLFNLPIVGNYLKRFILKIQHGERESEIMRCIAREKFNVEVGMYTYGCFAKDFNVGGSVEVGRYCSIAGNVHYFGANHPIDMASCSAYFYNKAFGFDVEDVPRGQLKIGNDVWIGYGTIITCRCTSIGNGAIIGAGSVVTGDIPPYAIVAGNPARILRMRFSEEEIFALEDSKWWLKKPSDIMKYYSSIKDISYFSAQIYKDE